MSKEKVFDKYETRSPDYHFVQINKTSLKTFNAFVEARLKGMVEKVDRFAKSIEGEINILDVGCGDGVALFLIKELINNKKVNIFGVDQSEKAICVAKNKITDGNFKVSSVYNIPFNDSYFDIVISSDVIEHVKKPENMLDEIKRVTRNNGFVVIGTPVKITKFPLDHNHAQEFFTEDLVKLMETRFSNCQLDESHNIITSLLYGYPTKNFINWKYLINIIAIYLRYNPFLRTRKNKFQKFTYMYVTGQKNV